jgi:hypothetical protein
MVAVDSNVVCGPDFGPLVAALGHNKIQHHYSALQKVLFRSTSTFKRHGKDICIPRAVPLLHEKIMVIFGQTALEPFEQGSKGVQNSPSGCSPVPRCYDIRKVVLTSFAQAKSYLEWENLRLLQLVSNL